ncbi:MAG TPA: hypothetical protein VID50_07480 [Candidatus Eisenbacteria bacterium]
MNQAAGRRSAGRGARIAILALGWVPFTWGAPGAAGAQPVAPDETPAVVGHGIHDYYDRYTDPSTATLLGTVERYHLGDSFWRYYREGAFNSARADLGYVLAYFPNHPRALHLLAYDPRLKLVPSLVIQQFELAIHSFPGHAYTYAQYGRYLASIGRQSVGIALLDEAIRMDPDLVVARAWRAEEEIGRTPSETEPSGGGR